MSGFGTIVSGKVVERAVAASLEIWMDGYLGEMERVDGYDANSIERPRGIVTASEFEKWPEDQLPVIVIISSGIQGKPTRRGDGSYEATWQIAVAPIASDMNSEETRDLASTMGAASRAALTQHKRLESELHPDGFGTSMEWVGEVPASIPFGDSRTLAAMMVMFLVTVDHVVEEAAGPRVPPENPAVPMPEGPQVTSIKVGAHPVELSGALS